MSRDHLPSVQPDSEYNEAGWKQQVDQLSQFPFVRHLWFGDKKDLLIPSNHDELESLINYLSANRSRYRQFLRQKARYPSFDIYACYHPFNEAFKALYPFVDLLKKTVREGERILNLWDRSGWTATMLGGWFPQNQIITVWEGDKDILGYRGFDYWMAPERRKNHTILFADFERPLPLPSSSVAAVVGFDVLHRFHQPELMSELLRIATPEAPMIFPHVHLTNNLPEPFFERGCTQLHGSDYQALFDQLQPVTGRQGYVLSEPATFAWNDRTTDGERVLFSEPAHSDYNACISWISQKEPLLKPWRGHEQPDWEEMYLLQNPLLAIDPVQHIITLGGESWGYSIAEFLTRHPVYQRKVQNSLGVVIEEDLQCVLYWAAQGLRLREILVKTSIEKGRLQYLLQLCWDLELAQALPIDEAGFRLQSLLGTQRYLPEAGENNLAVFWSDAVSLHADSPWCSTGGEVLTYEQAGELTQLVQRALAAEGLKGGDRILFCGETHSEFLLLFWAAVSMGITVVPLSPAQSSVRLHEYIDLVDPALVVTDPALYKVLNKQHGLKVIMIDEPADPHFIAGHSFEAWLESALESDAVPGKELPPPDTIAVILWTTGSTGNPKGIPITHAQLIRSGRVMTETYHWKKGDRYYALGGLEAMSGLRHVTVSVAEVGACAVLPVKGGSIHEHLDLIAEESITILTGNPSFFKHLLFAAKAAQHKTILSVRLALCTGNQLSGELRDKWKQTTGTDLYNYYGLTETTGICIAEPLHIARPEENSIGMPVDCLVKVVDEEGAHVPVGTVGELCIYGAGVFAGYFKNEAATQAALTNGWFHTGDLVKQDSKGGVQLCGRISDIIKLSSGERVELRAVEEAMAGVKGLKDWAVCPLREWEREAIAVFVVPNDTIDFDKIIAQINISITEAIGSFALPSLIEPVDHIPRGNHHKVLRKQLTDQYFQTLKQA